MSRQAANCPICGAAGMVRAARDLPYSYKGRETIIPAVVADWCNACGESLTGPDETGRVMRAMAAFQREIDNPHRLLTENSQAY